MTDLHALGTAAALTAALVAAQPAAAQQERVGGGAPAEPYHAGWTFTPAVGASFVYDDNVSLFGVGTASGQTDDAVSTLFPEADLHYEGKHTQFGTGYAGTLLNYRNYSALNRWDQRVDAALRRQESARLKWSATTSAAAVPSTDLVDLGGIPYRQSGARLGNVSTGAEYVLSAHSAVAAGYTFQSVSFDRTGPTADYLRGGRIQDWSASFRQKLDERLAVGADYSLRHAAVAGDLERFNIHTVEGAADYALAPDWTLRAAFGTVHLQSTATTAAHTGPAWRFAIERQRPATMFHASYQRAYIPSLGYGGTVRNEEASVGLRVRLTETGKIYVEQSGVLRNDQPLTDLTHQLPLRSFRSVSIVGWQPDRWVRVEGFYVRVQQSSLLAGGQVHRDRIGVQVVTSKPMRIP